MLLRKKQKKESLPWKHEQQPTAAKVAHGHAHVSSQRLEHVIGLQRPAAEAAATVTPTILGPPKHCSKYHHLGEQYHYRIDQLLPPAAATVIRGPIPPGFPPAAPALGSARESAVATTLAGLL